MYSLLNKSSFGLRRWFWRNLRLYWDTHWVKFKTCKEITDLTVSTDLRTFCEMILVLIVLFNCLMHHLVSCFNKFYMLLKTHKVLPLHAVVESVFWTVTSNKFASSLMATSDYPSGLLANCIEISLIDIADVDSVWCWILDHHHVIHVMIHIALLITSGPHLHILQIFSKFFILFIQW